MEVEIGQEGMAWSVCDDIVQFRRRPLCHEGLPRAIVELKHRDQWCGDVAHGMIFEPCPIFGQPFLSQGPFSCTSYPPICSGSGSIGLGLDEWSG